MIEAPTSEYLTAEEACAFLGGVSMRTFRRWRLRHYRIERTIRYRRDDLIAFMERHAVDVVTPRLGRTTRTPPKTTTPEGKSPRDVDDIIANFGRKRPAA